MATVTKFANANTVVTTGWTSPTNAYADDSVYTTSLPAKNASVTSDYGFPAFTTTDIPAGSTINSVTFEIQYKASTTGSTGSLIGVQGNNNGTLLGTETTGGMVLADTLLTKQYTSGIALADLQTANLVKLRLRGGRAASNTSITWSVDYVKVTVDYTLPPIAPSGVSSAQAFGAVTIVPGPVTKSVTGLSSAQAFGVIGLRGGFFFPSNNRFPDNALYPTDVPADTVVGGVSSAAAFGTVTPHPGAVAKPVTGLGSAQAFGTITLVEGGVTRSASGLASAASFGTVTIHAGGVTKTVSGLASAASFGAPVVSSSGIFQPVSGLASAANFGTPTPLPGPRTVVLSGLASAALFAAPQGNQRFAVNGISSAQAFGVVTPHVGTTIIAVIGVASAQTFGDPTSSGGIGPTFNPAVHGGHHHH